MGSRVHGRETTYVTYSCRCTRCIDVTVAARRAREDKRNKQRKAERIKVNGRMIHPLALHGTVNAYESYMCRCEDCSDAHNEANYMLRKKHAKERIMIDGALTHPSAKHGTRNGYSYWSCRCRWCHIAVAPTAKSKVRKAARAAEEKAQRATRRAQPRNNLYETVDMHYTSL